MLYGDKTCCHILAQVLSPPFPFFDGMPPLAVPVASQQGILARRWRQQNPGDHPLRIPLDTRRASVLARAAYWCATRDLSGEADTPAPGICNTCGRATHSWCEGCYLRTSRFGGAKFAAICNPCDKERFVCHNCKSQGIAWQDGHSQYLQETAIEKEDTETIEVTDPETGAITRITFQELAERLGRPAEDIKNEIFGAIGGTPPSSA